MLEADNLADVREMVNQVVTNSGLTRAEIARRCGRSRAWVTQSIRTGGLEPLSRIALECGFLLRVEIVPREMIHPREEDPCTTQP